MKSQKNSKWEVVAFEDAKNHELYGVKGWLLVYATVCAFGIISAWGKIKIFAYESGISVSDAIYSSSPTMKLFLVNLMIRLSLNLIIIYLLFTKNSKFRIYATVFSFAEWPLIAIVGLSSVSSGVFIFEQLTQWFMVWLLYLVIFVPYLNISKRVRITFENSIRSTR